MLKDPPAPGGRRLLAAVWVAECTALLGLSISFPFTPLFLQVELGIRSPGQIALWAGMSAAAAGFAGAVASPLWGLVADRFGRRAMLLRAIVGGGLSVGAIGLAQNVFQMVALRLTQGATSGTIAAATGLVAGETPRSRMGSALGMLGSAIAIGGAAGPLVGVAIVNWFGLRAMFVASGLLVLASMVPILMFTHERPRVHSGSSRLAMGQLAAMDRAVLRALGVLFVAQALMQTAYSAVVQLAALRILLLAPGTAVRLTGLAFGLAGLSAAGASVASARFARGLGYRRAAVLASGLMAAVIVGLALTAQASLIVLALVVAGFLYGALSPCLNSMIGLEAPQTVQATVFGVSYSALSIGYGLGPLLAGGIGATAGIEPALLVAASLLALLAVGLLACAREPAADASAVRASPAAELAARS